MAVTDVAEGSVVLWPGEKISPVHIQHGLAPAERVYKCESVD